MAKTKIGISSEGRTLAATAYEPDTNPLSSAVLLVHGFGSNRQRTSQYAKNLSEQGVRSLALDLGGHGNSTGVLSELSVDDHVKDVIAGYDVLATSAAAGEQRIKVAGISYGGYLAVLMTEERQPASLLLRAAPAYPDRLRSLPRSLYSNEDALAPPDAIGNDAFRALEVYKGSVAIVQSEFDEVVPEATTSEYLRARPNAEQHVLYGAAHQLTSNTQQAFVEILSKWARQPSASS